MKSIIIIFLSMIFVSGLSSQDQVQTYIREAQDFYTQKNYKQAQLSLQDAINELNKLMSGQLTEVLPAEINGLRALEANSNTAGMGMMGGGMQITKKYEHPAKKENEAEIQIIANSPMMNAANMYLSNPSLLGPNAKSVRVGTQRAVLKSEMEDYYDENGGNKKIRSTQIQIPLSQSLITINARGFATEQEELSFASKLDISKIKIAIGE
jgi:hypothetical protein